MCFVSVFVREGVSFGVRFGCGGGQHRTAPRRALCVGGRGSLCQKKKKIYHNLIKRRARLFSPAPVLFNTNTIPYCMVFIGQKNQTSKQHVLLNRLSSGTSLQCRKRRTLRHSILLSQRACGAPTSEKQLNNFPMKAARGSVHNTRVLLQWARLATSRQETRDWCEQQQQQRRRARRCFIRCREPHAASSLLKLERWKRPRQQVDL